MSIKVLVIEDDPETALLYTDIMDTLGHDMFFAANGEQGINLAKSELPDIILLDMRMPIMSGWNVAKHLKDTPETADIPIVAVTANLDTVLSKQIYESGCDAYVSKPFSPKKLKEIIAKHVPTPSD